MSINPLLVVGAGTFLGAAAVIAFNVVRSRRDSRLQARYDQLTAFARRAGLEYVGDRPRPEDLEAASWYRGADREVRADAFFQGQDRNGRYWVARRKVMGDTQEVIGFQIRGDLNVGQAYIEPSVSGARSGGTSWAKRLFAKPAPVSTTVVHWTVHRQASPQQIEDESARNSIDRWVTRLVARGKNEGRVPMGLEVRDGLGWVYSMRPLESGARLGDFLQHALELRAAVIQEVQRRPATISTPVNVVSGEADLRQRAETAPLFAVDVADGADIEADGKTVVLSAEDLLRETPVPKPKKKQRVGGVEIPDFDEEVEVIGTWGR